MSDAPTRPFGRFVTAPDHILLAMGVVPSPTDLLLLDTYKTWTGFPKPGKQGYSAEALFEWAAKNAETIAYRKKIGKMIQQGQDNTAADFKIIDQRASKSTFAADGQDYPDSISGLDRLGALIQRRFSGRGLAVEVSRQLITKWKRLQGVTAQPGLVPFPAPTSANRYNVRECFDWVEKWIVSDISPVTASSFGAAADAERELKEVNLRRALRMEQRELGEIIPFNDAQAYIAGIAEQIRKFYDRLLEGDGERSVRKVVAGTLGALGISVENQAAIDQQLLKRLETVHDELKTEFDDAKAYALRELELVRDQK